MALFKTQPITWSATLLSTLLVPRLLGAEGFGQYSAATNIAAIAGAVASLGVPSYVARRVATEPTRAAQYATGGIVISVGMAVLITVALSLALSFWPLPSGVATVLPVALAGTVVAVAQVVVLATLNGQERHTRYAWFNAATVVLGPLAGIGVLLAGANVVLYLLASVTITAIVVASGWYAFGLGPRGVYLDKSLILELLRGGMPFLGWTIAVRVRNQIDIILVAILLHEQAAGWLSAAYRIVLIPTFIPWLVVVPLTPALNRHADDPVVFARTLRQALVVILVLSVPVHGMMFALAPILPDLFGWGAAYAPSVPLMMVLVFAQPFAAIDMVLAVALIALRQERRWLVVGVAGAILNPSLNLLLIPVFDNGFQLGQVAAALVEVITEVLMLSGALLILPRGMIDGRTWWKVGLILIACTGMVSIVMVLRSVSIPLAVVTGGAAYLAAVTALGVIDPDQGRLLRQVVEQSAPCRLLCAKLARLH